MDVSLIPTVTLAALLFSVKVKDSNPSVVVSAAILRVNTALPLFITKAPVRLAPLKSALVIPVPDIVYGIVVPLATPVVFSVITEFVPSSTVDALLVSMYDGFIDVSLISKLTVAGNFCSDNTSVSSPSVVASAAIVNDFDANPFCITKESVKLAPLISALVIPVPVISYGIDCPFCTPVVVNDITATAPSFVAIGVLNNENVALLVITLNLNDI